MTNNSQTSSFHEALGDALGGDEFAGFWEATAKGRPESQPETLEGKGLLGSFAILALNYTPREAEQLHERFATWRSGLRSRITKAIGQRLVRRAKEPAPHLVAHIPRQRQPEPVENIDLPEPSKVVAGLYQSEHSDRGLSADEVLHRAVQQARLSLDLSKMPDIVYPPDNVTDMEQYRGKHRHQAPDEDHQQPKAA